MCVCVCHLQLDWFSFKYFHSCVSSDGGYLVLDQDETRNTARFGVWEKDAFPDVLSWKREPLFFFFFFLSALNINTPSLHTVAVYMFLILSASYSKKCFQSLTAQPLKYVCVCFTCGSRASGEAGVFACLNLDECKTLPCKNISQVCTGWQL